MSYRNPQCQDRLAAEYVLGTLHGRARARFETLLREDPALRARVALWQTRLQPLADTTTPVAPPERVWRNIESQLGHSASRKRLRTPWQSLAMLAAGIVLGFAVILGVQHFHSPDPMQLVVIPDAKAEPMWIVSSSQKPGMLKIKTLRQADMPSGKHCVLWLKWDDGYMHAVGTLSEKPGMTEAMAMPGDRKRNPMKAKVMVSIETAASEYTQPRGEMLFTGRWVEL